MVVVRVKINVPYALEMNVNPVIVHIVFHTSVLSCTVIVLFTLFLSILMFLAASSISY